MKIERQKNKREREKFKSVENANKV